MLAVLKGGGGGGGNRAKNKMPTCQWRWGVRMHNSPIKGPRTMQTKLD